jgi:proline iminopeptidase
MRTFSAPDGTELGYRLVDEGDPVVCLPGGPMRASTYLGNLGGLAAWRQLVLLDLRGTGTSATPDDSATYRCDRQVDDVEALRVDLGLERMDLLGHSAGANLAVLYATRRPDRVRRLVLVTPGLAGVGIDVTGEARRELVRQRAGEPWFAGAYAALERLTSGDGTAEDWTTIAPFFYGRWDEVAREHYAAGERESNAAAAETFGSDGAFDPPASRKALAIFDAPVLLLAGELDANTIPVAAAEYAALFPNAELVVQPGAGHYPWLDDPDRFAATVGAFLAAS